MTAAVMATLTSKIDTLEQQMAQLAAMSKVLRPFAVGSAAGCAATLIVQPVDM